MLDVFIQELAFATLDSFVSSLQLKPVPLLLKMLLNMHASAKRSGLARRPSINLDELLLRDAIFAFLGEDVDLLRGFDPKRKSTRRRRLLPGGVSNGAPTIATRSSSGGALVHRTR